jgi:POT family proton-dependent oligopeptide transporter
VSAPRGPTPPGAATAQADRFPPGIPYIVGNEGAERFSYYGMRAILWLYLFALFTGFVPEATLSPDARSSAEAHATEIMHLFVAGVYAFPLLGAIIADRWLGKYRVIMWGSVLYVCGHAVLAIAGRLGELRQLTPAQWGLYLGLSLVAFASGGIKPCVSANVGDQFTKENGHLVTKVFQIFYFMINFGSFVSTLMTPKLFQWFGPDVAFAVPGLLMAVAAVVFFLGRHRFAKVPPKPGGLFGLLDAVVTLLLLTPLLVFAFGGILPAIADAVFRDEPFVAGRFVVRFAGAAVAAVLGLFLFTVRQGRRPDNSFLPVLVYAARHQRERKPGQRYFDIAREKYGEEAGDGPPAVLRIMLVFSMVAAFWALFDQHASTWVAQAKQMGLGLTLPATTAVWAAGAAVVLTLFAGVWVISWVSNRKLQRRTVLAMVGTVLAVGAVAALNDLAGLVSLEGRIPGVKLSGWWMTLQLSPAQLLALNPFLVMVIIPLLNVAVYAPLRTRGREVSPLQKMTVGMFLAAIAFAAAAVVQRIVEMAGPGQVHSLWQLVQYVFMTTSEVLVSITGLEFAYTQAPRAMKSTIMSFWLLCITLGNLLVAFLSPLQEKLPLSSFFWVFAFLMGAAAVLFAVLAYFYQGKTYLQEAPAH